MSWSEISDSNKYKVHHFISKFSGKMRQNVIGKLPEIINTFMLFMSKLKKKCHFRPEITSAVTIKCAFAGLKYIKLELKSLKNLEWPQCG